MVPYIKKTTLLVVVAVPEVLLEEGLAASPRHILDQDLRHHRLGQAPLHATVITALCTHNPVGTNTLPLAIKQERYFM